MTLNDIQANTDRILNTPLPLAYAIAISQLTWVYILILPFQLYTTLGMVAIPGTLCKPSPPPHVSHGNKC